MCTFDESFNAELSTVSMVILSWWGETFEARTPASYMTLLRKIGGWKSSARHWVGVIGTRVKTKNDKTKPSHQFRRFRLTFFYGNLYASHVPKPPVDVNDPRAPHTRHFTDDLPEVDVALKLFTNAFEDVFKTLSWDGLGQCEWREPHASPICRQHIFNSRIVARFGLGMNLDKTKVMLNDHIILEPIYVKT